MIINIQNGRKYKKIIDSILERAVRHQKQPYDKIETNIVFVSQYRIKRLNKQFLGKDKCTDVLSFPSLSLTEGEIVSPESCAVDINEETGCIFLGDIAICLDVAKEQAEQLGHSIEHEIERLVLHGFLHLLGYDHDTESNSGDKMRQIEEELLLGD